mgnify:FL=1
MTIDTNAILSVSEANQNFSRATRITDAKGKAVIFKNNRPKYLLIDMDNEDYIDLTDDEKLDVYAVSHICTSLRCDTMP